MDPLQNKPTVFLSLETQKGGQVAQAHPDVPGGTLSLKILGCMGGGWNSEHVVFEYPSPQFQPIFIKLCLKIDQSYQDPCHVRGRPGVDSRDKKNRNLFRHGHHHFPCGGGGVYFGDPPATLPGGPP